MSEERPVGSPLPRPRMLVDRNTMVPLDGYLERHRFAPLFTAIMVAFIALILFQVVYSPAAIAILLILDGVPIQNVFLEFGSIFGKRSNIFFVANSIGQFLGLALPTLIIARWHTSRPGSFLRLRSSDLRLVGMAVAGLFAITPVVQWLGTLNELIPLPQWLENFEQKQANLLEQMLQQNRSVLFNLATLAVTPAICEELLFRGYIQRQGERSLGIVGGIAFSGILFGLYHFRLSQLIPLSVLGLYLAYIVWETGSLWPAMLVHFLNNALAVAMGAYASRHPELKISDVEQVQMPWFAVVAGALAFGFIVMAMRNYGRSTRPDLSKPDVEEVL